MRCVPLFALALIGAGSLEAQTPARTDSLSEIVVSATATRTVPPDYAIVRFGVSTDRTRAAEAAQANAQAAAAVRDALRSTGISLDSAAVSNYSLQARRDRDQRVAGYVARSEIQVAVRDLTRVGQAIDAALGAGATDVSSLTFAATSVDAARDSAYAAAVRAVYHNATTVAAAAGGRLAGPARLNVAEQQGPVPCASCLRSYQQPPTELTPGLVAVSVSVSGVFRFVPR